MHTSSHSSFPKSHGVAGSWPLLLAFINLLSLEAGTLLHRQHLSHDMQISRHKSLPADSEAGSSSGAPNIRPVSPGAVVVRIRPASKSRSQAPVAASSAALTAALRTASKASPPVNSNRPSLSSHSMLLMKACTTCKLPYELVDKYLRLCRAVQGCHLP